MPLDIKIDTRLPKKLKPIMPKEEEKKVKKVPRIKRKEKVVKKTKFKKYNKPKAHIICETALLPPEQKKRIV